MLPESWTPLRYHPVQAKLWASRSRFRAVVAGRGSGKTELARRYITRMLRVNKNLDGSRKTWNDPLYFYAMPTYAQAKRVVWRKLLSLIPKEWIDGRPNLSEMCIRTVFGSTLYVLGMDRPERAEGVQWDGGIVDESSDQKPGVFDLTLMPALSHRTGWCWRIGVPKRYGIGASEFREFYDQGVRGEGVESFTWTSEDILTPEQLAWAKMHTDAQDYSEQYLANFENAGGLVFHAFSDANIEHREYDPSKPLIVCSDFNINPMSWCFAQEHENNVYIIDELFMRNCNTQLALDALAMRYAGRHMSDWEFFGDAAGRARDTSATETDYLQIRNDDRFKPKRVYYPKANPSRRDRYASCNAMLCSAAGVRRVFISPKCTRLIADCRSRAYVPGTFDTNDTVDMGHMSDAMGYFIHRRYPMRLNTASIPGKVLIR